MERGIIDLTLTVGAGVLTFLVVTTMLLWIRDLARNRREKREHEKDDDNQWLQMNSQQPRRESRDPHPSPKGGLR